MEQSQQPVLPETSPGQYPHITCNPYHTERQQTGAERAPPQQHEHTRSLPGVVLSLPKPPTLGQDERGLFSAQVHHAHLELS